MSNPISIYLVSSETDVTLRKELEKHLAILRQQGRIKGYQESLAGAEWRKEQAKAFEEAGLILILVSADLLASKMCDEEQMQHALERQRKGQVHVVPIVIRPVAWQGAPFAHLPVLPTNLQAVTLWPNQDAAWMHITEGIECILEGKPFPEVQEQGIVRSGGQQIQHIQHIQHSAVSFSGNVTTTNIQGGQHHHYYPPVIPQAETTAKKVWMVPYAQNPFFTGRETELAAIQQGFQGTQTQRASHVQGISGLGGIGKTQIAVEYAYQHREAYEQILWASAETEETLTAAWTQIAVQLDLLVKDAQDQQRVRDVIQQWLTVHEKWLLILDNADEPAILEAFFPSAVGGHVLITTRAGDLSTLGFGLGHALEIETLTPEQGAAFLLQRAGLLARDASLKQASAEEQQRAMELSQTLGGLPLALDQVGAYLKATKRDLATYQQLYQTHRKQLLLERRGKEHPDPVATTWKLSFERVETADPAAAELLRLCSFLSPDAIPEWMLTTETEAVGTLLAPVLADAYRFDQAIEILQAYSLLKRNAGQYSLHRLVQVVLRDTMTKEEEEGWKQHIIQWLYEVSPDVTTVEQWSRCEQWVPHVLESVEWMEQRGIWTTTAAWAYSHAGYYLQERGRYREAQSLLVRALVMYEHLVGAEHPDTASCLNRLGTLYYSQRSYALAAFLYERALAIREQTLGPEHLAVAESLNSLGILYSRSLLGFAAASASYTLGFLDRMQRWFPPAKSFYQHTLVRIYPDQKSFANAEPLYRRALAIREQIVGSEHPDTAEILNNLALYYWSQGKLAQAEPLYRRALAIRERSLGSEHPATAESFYNLALFYHSQVKRKTFPEAEQLYLRALAIGEQKLGAGHPFNMPILFNLFFLYLQWGNFEKAEPVVRHMLDISEQQLKPDDPSLKEFREFYASYIRRPARIVGRGRSIWEKLRGTSQSAHVESFALLEPVMQEELESMEGFDAVQSLNMLALRYSHQGKTTEAEIFFRYALAACDQNPGSEHPDTVQIQESLAFAYEQLGQYEKAELLYERIFTMNEQNLGLEHPDTLKSLNTLVRLHILQKDYVRAIAASDKLLLFDSKNTRIYQLRGNAYYAQQDYVHAIADYTQAILLDPKNAALYNYRGNAYRRQEDYAHTIADYAQAILLDHKNAAVYFNRGDAYSTQQDYVHAIADYDQAILLDPKNAAFYSSRGNAYHRQKDYVQTITNYDQAILLDPKNAAFYNQRGHAYYAQQNYVQAIDDYTQAVSLDPNNASLYFNRGDAYDHQDDSVHAVADFDQAILLDPKNATFYNQRGYVYYFQNEYAQAITDFDQAILLNSHYADAYIGRSYVYKKQGDFTHAIADLDQWLLLDPKDILIYYMHRGDIYYLQQDYARAIADYTQAISLDPQNAGLYNDRGNAYTNQRDFAQAIADYTQAISFDPQNAVFYNNRAGSYYLLNEYVHSITDLDQVLLLDPKHVGAYNVRGNAHRNQGNYTQAIADYTQALSLAPDDALVYSNRGYAYSLQNDFPRALADLDRALLLDPKDATAYYRRGHVHCAQQAYLQAFADYEQAILLDPNDATIHDRRSSPHLAERDYRQASADLEQASLVVQYTTTAHRLRQMLIEKFGLGGLSRGSGN